MDTRPLLPPDLDRLRDIDATADLARYLHVDQSPADADELSVSWSVRERPLRERRSEPNTLSDDVLFTARQVASGIEDGVAVVTEYDGQLLAFMLATPDPAFGLLRLHDLRVDYDYRRQGIGTALAYQLLQIARETEVRAVAAETRSDNLPAARFLAKLGFKLSGVDTARHSNHDLVKERATLVWYASV